MPSVNLSDGRYNIRIWLADRVESVPDHPVENRGVIVIRVVFPRIGAGSGSICVNPCSSSFLSVLKFLPRANRRHLVIERILTQVRR